MDIQRIPNAPGYIRAFEQLRFGLYSQIGKGKWYMDAHNRKMEDYSRLRDTFEVDNMRGRLYAKSAETAHSLFKPDSPSTAGSRPRWQSSRQRG